MQYQIPMKSKIINAEINIYAAASAHTAIRDSFEAFITFFMILKLFEYRIIRNTFSTFIARIKRRIRNALKLLLRADMDGNIESKSIIAIAENGYLVKIAALFISVTFFL